ncbi:hypothetical protein [Aestuariivivens marinum]|uniref:hypothetical protein n=1 Tax=Aestuariivivens marinum TaxID=2913555 RepID=UPI001F55B61E|nr:hypothetical protein [Aestuariivivens marinum]
MRAYSVSESKRRDSYIKHHFEVGHLSYQERDQLGFLGEFACCQFLGIDWKDNIREDYLEIDSYDFIVKGLKADVKSETIPYSYAQKILSGQIKDNELYGRRLINKGQFSLLRKYDIVIFSFFIRNQLDYWYPIGYLEANIILNNYPPTFKRPDGGRYPFPGSPVPTSLLKPILNLT